MMTCPRPWFILSLAACLWCASADSPADDWTFRVTYADSVRAEPYTGRVYLFFGLRDNVEPRRAMSWFRPQPLLALDVQNWDGRQPLSLAPGANNIFRYPRDWTNVNLQGRHVQAVVRFNPWERKVGTGVGNGTSVPVSLTRPGPVDVVINQLIPERPFQATTWSKEFKVRSELLSRFHGRDVDLQSVVSLPASYFSDSRKRYPVVYTIPGFGGTHRYGRRTTPTPRTNPRGVEFIEVTLDPSCPLGHHVFADSDNNGPWGTALVTEFLPALDAAYRSDARPQARFLTGHSSGGWSSLWLQITYPDHFGGTWSTAPDPVDFRDFQRINIYRPGENMYRDPAGERRPLARTNGRVELWYDNFNLMEDVLGYGGQLHSFEAVFSKPVEGRRPVTALSMIDAPPVPAPQPELLWNRTTGDIDPVVAEQWKRYDIRLILEENWPTLGPKIEGKLHVIMGTEDTFYLDGATRLLKESLERLGSDAQIELIPGRDHSNLLDPALIQRIEAEMAQAYAGSI